MRKSLLTIGMGLAVSSATVLTSVAALPGVTALQGHVPAAVAQLQPNGQLPVAAEIKLAIGLPLRNQAALTNLLQQLYDPASPNYHHYLAPDEFTAQFGPTEQDYQKVVSFARTNGFTVVGTSSNRTLVDVSAKVADVERAFHVRLLTYRHPTEARDFFAPDVEPTLDASLPVLSIGGLNNYVLAKPLYHANSSHGRSLDHFATGSSPSGSYWGYDFRNAYAPGTTLTGAGQSVALFECDGYFNSDVSSYLTASGVPAVPLKIVLIDGFNGLPSGIGGEVEVALDIDMANSMAPGLSQIIVYEGPGDSPAFNLDILNRIATDNLARQISSSWLIDDTPQFAQIYQQYAVQGQSFFQASGDSGAYYPGIFQFEDSPLVTLVGGTTLTSTGSGGVWTSETVWNNGFDPFVGHQWASGGGISATYTIPSWQSNINMTANLGSTTKRNIPDVALTADNIYIFGDGFPLTNSGGTSAAAPLWAGFMALVNQQAAANGRPALGFINPLIYSLAQTANYTNLFHDIIIGNNTNPFSPNLFSAVPGYDLCTGWGTPNGISLITALAGAPVLPVSPPAPPYGANFFALNGGNPNGAWELFVQDDTPLDSGTNSGGWILNLTLASPVIGAADNQLLMTAAATNVPFGSNIVYTLSVTNYGPSPSTNVFVSDTLPAGVTLVSASPPGASTNATQLTWNVGTLATNAGTRLTLTVLPAASGSYQNYAIVSAFTPDPNPDDITASVTVTVIAGAPPRLTNTVVNLNGTFQLTVNGQSGQEYIVQASTNLINWVPVYTNPPPFVSPFTFTDSNTTAYPDRFYRVVTGP